MPRTEQSSLAILSGARCLQFRCAAKRRIASAAPSGWKGRAAGARPVLYRYRYRRTTGHSRAQVPTASTQPDSTQEAWETARVALSVPIGAHCFTLRAWLQQTGACWVGFQHQPYPGPEHKGKQRPCAEVKAWHSCHTPWLPWRAWVSGPRLGERAHPIVRRLPMHSDLTRRPITSHYRFRVHPTAMPLSASPAVLLSSTPAQH
jgi:hypothetical protein